jgi:hypothetical protein
MTLVEFRRETDPNLEIQILKRQRKLEKAFLWIAINGKELRTKYPNKYIAVEELPPKGEQGVKYSAKSIDKLIEIIMASGENVEDFAIEYINTQPKNLLL